ncbi:MAG: hypothetical protein KAH99_02820, partial [Verrucomicrobia bacterium]|nr:hypothetical protein [Verrucomicrobiota bacterium]
MKLLKPSLLVLMLLGLPLAGVWVAGHDVAAYLEFPPCTQYVQHAPFSWPVFIGLVGVILAVVLPFIIQTLRHSVPGSPPPATTRAAKAVAGGGDPGNVPQASSLPARAKGACPAVAPSEGGSSDLCPPTSADLPAMGGLQGDFAE